MEEQMNMLEKVQNLTSYSDFVHETQDNRTSGLILGGAPGPLWSVDILVGETLFKTVGWSTGPTVWLGGYSGTQLHVSDFYEVRACFNQLVKSENLRAEREAAPRSSRETNNIIQFKRQAR